MGMLATVMNALAMRDALEKSEHSKSRHVCDSDEWRRGAL